MAQRVQKVLANKKLRIAKHRITKDIATGKPIKVIVKLSSPTARKTNKSSQLRTLSGRAQMRQSVRSSIDLIAAGLNNRDIQIRNKFSYTPGFSAQISSLESLEELFANEGVVAVYEDQQLVPMTSQGLSLMSGIVPRSRYNGAGISVAILDTGIDYNHPMLGGGGFPNSKVIGGVDTGDDDFDPFDLYGHGTAVAGIAAGAVPSVSATDYTGGVASGAKLYAVKMSHSDEYGSPTGYAWTSDIIEAVEWCITHQYDDPAAPIMVANISFGMGYYTSICDTDSYAEAGVETIENATLAGIAIFASSGNNGYTQGLSLPACYSGVVSVGAVYDADVGYMSYGTCSEDGQVDTVACYSNSSADLDLFAPGNNAFTTDTLGSSGTSSGDYDSGFGGTSASSPYAAGSAAIIQSAYRMHRGVFLAPEELRTILVASGDLLTDQRTGIVQPRVNLDAAVSSFLTPGDVNGDGVVDIADSIDSLKIVSDTIPTSISVYSDINDDGRVGLAESLYGLLYAAGLVCVEGHLDACASLEECETADGFWYEGGCHLQPSCDATDLSQCNTAKECTFVGGFWLPDQSVCVPDPTNEIEPNNSEGTANRIYLDVSVTAQLSEPTDIDTFFLTIDSPEVVEVSFSTTVTSTFWYVSVHKEDGTMISRHDVGNNDFFNVALPDTGTYFLKISVDSTHSSVLYTLKVSAVDSPPLAALETEPNNRMETADTVSYAKQISGQLMDLADDDWFIFEADAGQDIGIAFSTTVASTYWLISVYDENHTLIAQADVGNNGVITASLPDSGSYFIVVQPDDVLSDDQYSLTVESL